MYVWSQRNLVAKQEARQSAPKETNSNEEIKSVQVSRITIWHRHMWWSNCLVYPRHMWCFKVQAMAACVTAISPLFPLGQWTGPMSPRHYPTWSTLLQQCQTCQTLGLSKLNLNWQCSRGDYQILWALLSKQGGCHWKAQLQVGPLTDQGHSNPCKILWQRERPTPPNTSCFSQ